jgi:hypothetical protein
MRHVAYVPRAGGDTTSAPAEVLDAVVVDAEVVGELVNHDLPDQRHQLRSAAGPGLEGAAVQDEPVDGPGGYTPTPSGGVRGLVAPEGDLVSCAGRGRRWQVGDVDLDTPDVLEQRRGQGPERVADHPVEAQRPCGSVPLDGTPPRIRGATTVPRVAIVHGGRVVGLPPAPVGEPRAGGESQHSVGCRLVTQDHSSGALPVTAQDPGDRPVGPRATHRGGRTCLLNHIIVV